MKKKIILGLLLAAVISAPTMVAAQVNVRGSRVAQSRPILRPKPLPLPTQQWTSTLFAYSSTLGQTDANPFITASGATVGDGIVANNCLPFGTKVRFPKLFGTKDFVVQDRMAPRHGCYAFDIWYPSTAAARQFGRQVAGVEIYE